jgi:hypothetical protein
MALVVTPTATVTMLVVTGSITVLTAACVALRAYLRDRPPARTSARDRLLARNPTLAFRPVSVDVSTGNDADGDDVHRWSVSARRVRTGLLTSLLVSVALLVASSRPRVATGTATNDR